jgi:hypothetical protein
VLVYHSRGVRPFAQPLGVKVMVPRRASSGPATWFEWQVL